MVSTCKCPPYNSRVDSLDTLNYIVERERDVVVVVVGYLYIVPPLSFSFIMCHVYD